MFEGLIHYRPPRHYAEVGARHVQLFSKCPCLVDAELVFRVLSRLAMPHAAAMHAAPSARWSAADWRTHIQEERAKLFPALLAAGAEQSDIDELEADHVFYLSMLEGQIGPEVELPRGDMLHSIDTHGGIEDLLIEEFGPAILGEQVTTSTASVGADIYTQSGVPAPPSSSTGNSRSDEWRSNVHKWAASAALVQPELAPFLAAGVLIFDGWIAFGAFLSGESKDDDKYQDQAKLGVQMFLTRGFIPRKWITDVEFAADYAHFLGQQINALTLYPPGDTFVEELTTDLGRTIIDYADDPRIVARLKKGSASPFSGSVPDPSWRYGIYDSYPDPDLLGLVAAARFGGDVGAMQKKAAESLAILRPKTWPTDVNDQAYAAANATAYVWHALGGKSRGYFQSAGGACVDPATNLVSSKCPKGIPPPTDFHRFVLGPRTPNLQQLNPSSKSSTTPLVVGGFFALAVIAFVASRFL